ncbi:MAG: DUF4406 domain-containing protein [Bacteroidales bacterium]|jgi:hypothetical protein|nr:DUF4406 domain-containing protein [Bacteroidales bacterium]
MKIYISLPIIGKDEAGQRQKSKKWQKHFEDKGHEVINPFDLSDNLDETFIKLGKKPLYKDYMIEDLVNLAFCTHLFLCDGWSESKGCITEVEIAYKHKIKFLFERNFKI